MFQWDNALIYLGLTIFAVAGAQPTLGVPMIYLYVMVAVFGSGLAVGIRWWQGHLKTAIARIIAFIAGVFGSALFSPWLMSKFALDGLDALMVIGVTSMISARVIVFFTAKMDVEKLGNAAAERVVKIINPAKTNSQGYDNRYPDYRRDDPRGYDRPYSRHDDHYDPEDKS